MKSIDTLRMTKFLTLIFGGLIFLGDVFSLIIVKYICLCIVNKPELWCQALLEGVLVAGSIVAYIVFYNLFGLIKNLQKEHVFISENVKKLNIVAACCVIGAAIASVGMFVWTSMFFVVFIALFMALIVRSVAIVFTKAVSMKEEVDLTI